MSVTAEDPLVRKGLRATVDTFPFVHVVEETTSLSVALRRAKGRETDVVIACPVAQVDTATLRRFRENDCAVVMVAEAGIPGHLLRGIQAGVRRFVDKTSSASDLGRAVAAAARGEAFLSPTFTGAVLDWLDTQVLPGDGATGAELASLTEREHQVLELLGRAYSNTEIARQLRIRETTVRSHVSNLLTKLRLRTRSEIVVLGYRQRLFERSP